MLIFAAFFLASSSVPILAALYSSVCRVAGHGALVEKDGEGEMSGENMFKTRLNNRQNGMDRKSEAPRKG